MSSNSFHLKSKFGQVKLLAATLYDWLVKKSQDWSFLKILDAAGKLAIVVVVAKWAWESGDRVKERHYKAWEMINSARGGSGDGGRKDALQDLDHDGVPLKNISANYAFISEIKLPNAKLSGSLFCLSNLYNATLTGADLDSADLRGSTLAIADLRGASLQFSKLSGAKMFGSVLIGAKLT